MNEEFRAFRILLVPLALFIIFFMITPRYCAKAVEKAKANQQTPKPAGTTGGGITGLQLETPAPSGIGGKAVTDFPAGLDAARIQYLVEIDRLFSEPKTVILARKFDEKDPVQKALIKLQYAEVSGDAVVLTRDGNMNLTGLVETDTGWKVIVAKRSFDELSFIDRVEDERYKATFRWHWQTNAVGNQLGIDAKGYNATAEFGGGASSWVLTSWIVPPVEPEK